MSTGSVGDPGEPTQEAGDRTGVGTLEPCACPREPDLVNFRIPLVDDYEEVGQHEKAVEIVREIRAVNPVTTAEEAATASFVVRSDDQVPALMANLQRGAAVGSARPTSRSDRAARA